MRNHYRFSAETKVFGIPMTVTINCFGFRLAKKRHAEFKADGMYFGITDIVKVVRNS